MRLVGIIVLSLAIVTTFTACSADGDSEDLGERDAGTDTVSEQDLSTGDTTQDPDAQSRDADAVGDGNIDIAVSNIRLEQISNPDSNTFHVRILGDVENVGGDEAEGVSCAWRIVRASNEEESAAGDMDVAASVSVGQSVTAEGEIYIVSDEDSYNASYEVSCTADDEAASRQENNTAAFESSVVF